MLSEKLDEAIVGESACLRESMHSLADFHADAAVVDHGFKFVAAHDVCWDVFNSYAHAFIFCHRGVEVEVFDVGCAEFGVGCGQQAVEETFDCGEVGCELGP